MKNPLNKKISERRIFKVCYSVFVSITSILIFAIPVFADNDWGDNVKTWLLRQASALAICAAVIIMIPLLLKKMWAGLIGTIAGAAVAIFFVSNPDKLSNIGDAVYRIIFG